MTTFEQEFGGTTHRFAFGEEPKQPFCWQEHLGPYGDFGTGIEEDGTITPIRRCENCRLLLPSPPNDRDTLTKCGLGPVHYNRQRDLEANYSARLLERLEQCGWRIVGREVTGRHKINGAKLRVDYLIEPPDQHRWKDKAVTFALECKRHEGGWKEKASAMWQAIDYTHTDWPGYGCLPVLVSPPPWEGNTFVQHMLGKGRIGELAIETPKWQWTADATLQRVQTKLTVRMSGHVLWAEGQGVGEGARWSMQVSRYGSAR